MDAFNRLHPEGEPLPRLVLISAYGPINFALANNDSADGGFRPDLISGPGGDGGIDLQKPSHRRYFIHGYQEGLRWIAGNPRRAARLWLLKIDRWLDGLRLGWGLSNWPAGLTGARPPVDLFVPERGFLKWPLVLLMSVGGVLAFGRQHREYSICSLVVLHRFVVTALFFGYARGLVVILPVVLPLLLLPLQLVFREHRRERDRIVRGIAVLLLGAALAQALVIRLRGPRNYVASGPMDPRTGKLIQDERLEIWPKAQP